MNRNITVKKRSKKFTPIGIVFAALGVALFVYFIRKAGVHQIAEGVERLGAGFLLVFAISAIRPIVRAAAWMLCLESPHGLRFRDAFRAYVIGDAIGTLVPLGIVVSEPAKAAFVRERVPMLTGLSSLAVENLFYSLSVVITIFCGAVALLWSFPLENEKPLRIASAVALVVILVSLPFAYMVVRRQWKFLSGSFNYLAKRGIGQRLLAPHTERVASLEEKVYGFYARNQRRFLPILLLEFCFHLAGVAEVYTTLSFISTTLAPTLLTAFILESVNRLVNVVFKIVPMRAGVDEGATELIARVLGFATGLGVTLGIIRKARIICWTLVGAIFVAQRGLSLRKIAEESEALKAANEGQTSAPVISES